MEAEELHRKVKSCFTHLIPLLYTLKFTRSKERCDRLILALVFNNAKLPKEAYKTNCLYEHIVKNLKYNRYVSWLLLENIQL
jgi:hypothetical protein